MTEWKRLASPYRNYEVSDEGDARRNGKVLKGYVDRYGYHTILLSYAGLPRRHKMHRLVCEAFNGACPEGLECAHIDGNPRNNSPTNLAWVTRKENNAHKSIHGTHQDHRGAKHPQAKLSDADVADIRRRFALGESGRSLAKQFNIGSAHASRIIRGDVRQDAPESETP